jgi:hypothetical protein
MEYSGAFDFDDLKAEWERHFNWRKDHLIFALCEDFFDFFRYTIPRVTGEGRREIRWAWQRVFRGYDDRLVWSLHSEHTRLMLKVLKHFRKTHIGSPIIRDKDWKENGEGPGDSAHTFWDKQLDAMIDGFQAQMDIEDLDYADFSSDVEKKKYKELIAMWEKGMKVFVEHYNDLWD